jgi:hypothetical protein
MSLRSIVVGIVAALLAFYARAQPVVDITPAAGGTTYSIELSATTFAQQR